MIQSDDQVICQYKNPTHSMESNIVLVPMEVKGLLVDQPQFFTEATGQYQNLPASYDGFDFNPDSPYVSESVLAQPFEDNNLQLRKGLHLHWQLPQTFFTSSASAKAHERHSIPNRWLITKKKGQKVLDQWVVESDYLHPAAGPFPDHAIAFPVEIDHEQPYRKLGRQLLAKDWTEDQSADRLKQLTTMGYGDPSFAVFYPNCFSVLGCYDDQVTQADHLIGLSYQVLGWYSDIQKDPIYQLLNKQKATSDVQQLIREALDWEIGEAKDITPSGLVCRGELHFNPGLNTVNPNKSAPLTVSIGNSGTEALSALLGHQIRKHEARILEDQLENLHLLSALEGQVLDIGPRFHQARHARTFNRIKGPNLWQIKAQKTISNLNVWIDLPVEIIRCLQQLNTEVHQLEKTASHIHHMKGVTFADWYKYMVAAYPPMDQINDLPETDHILFYIQKHDLSPLKKLDQTSKNHLDNHQQLVNTVKTNLTSINSGRAEASKYIQRLTFPKASLSGKYWKSSGAVWNQNQPFCEGCLSFSGTGWLETQVSQPTVALSCWLWLSETSAPGTVALANGKHQLLALEGITDFWQDFQINGRPCSPENLDWSDIPKQQWVHLYIEWKQPMEQDVLYLMGAPRATGVRGRLACLELYTEALDPVEQCAVQNCWQHLQYNLKMEASEPYIEPKEPAVLLEGKAVNVIKESDQWLDAEGNLPCNVLKSVYPETPDDCQSILKYLKKEEASEHVVGHCYWRNQPWNPIRMEWEVAFEPYERWQGDLDTELLGENFQLEHGQYKLSPKGNLKPTGKTAYYRGHTDLSPHGKKVLTDRIQQHLHQLTLKDCADIRTVATTGEKEAYRIALKQWFETQKVEQLPLTKFKAWYLKKPVFKEKVLLLKELSKAEQLDDFNWGLLTAYEKLQSYTIASQALSGFNNALLTLHQVIQLSANDPLGFDHYQRFTEQVKQGINGGKLLAPLLYDQFLPLRLGLLSIHQLKIVDSFGQYRSNIDLTNCIVSNSLQVPSNVQGKNSQAWLSPRFLQATQLRFHWLSALTGLPTRADSPICGWLLINEVDNSLEVYDAAGAALGIVDQEAQWQQAPGAMDKVAISQFENRNLSRLMEWFIKQGENELKPSTFITNFCNALSSALLKIAPESYVHHDELAMIMGRPLAVVRASLDVIMEQPPAINHSWSAFQMELMGAERDTAGMENIQIPFRLGDPAQFNDGLAAFWIEHESEPGNCVYHTGDDSVVFKGIQPNDQASPLLTNTASGAPTSVTLLMDPSGAIHASSGILPAARLQLDPNTYQTALQNLSMTLRAMPLLMPVDRTALPLPHSASYHWTWLQKNGANWEHAQQNGIIEKQAFVSEFKTVEGLWSLLLEKSWLKLISKDLARIQPVSSRKENQLAPPFSTVQKQVEQWLEKRMIVPLPTEAQFDGTISIKEGWLQLTKNHPPKVK